MAHEDAIREAFPQVDDIQDDGLREGVLSAWDTTLSDTGFDLQSGPWFPPSQEKLGLPDVTLLDHVRDVLEGSIALAEVVAQRNPRTPDLDTVIAGALVHDVSKPYEYDGMDETEIGRLLGHPRYGIHVAARAGLPVEVIHVVACHSPRTSLEPATLEAEIIMRADEVAASAIRMGAVDDLRDA